MPMKRLFYIMAMTVSAAFASCSGNADPEDNTGNGTPVQPFTLSADKSFIESDGKDVATFTIRDANGLDLTGKDFLKKTSFHIEETDEYLSGMILSAPNEFTAIADGTYTVSAMYDGKACENKVSITAKNRSRYEMFSKKVAIYRLTGTWCQYCPAMTNALGKINSFSKEKSIVLEFHNGDEFSLTSSGQDLAGILLSRFSKEDEGLPYCIYSLDEGSGKKTALEIQDLIKKQLYENPARTGIKATSVTDKSGIRVSATVKASVTGKYDLGMAILEDNMIPAAGNAYEPVYNDVVVSISGNFFAMASDTAFNLEAGQEKMLEKVYLSTEAIGKTGNMRIVLFTLRESGNKVIIDNAVEFRPGENIDYKYN